MPYRCLRCHYETLRKSSMRDHFCRKTPCSPSHSDVSILELSRRLESDSIACVCSHCDKPFASEQYLAIHSKKCRASATSSSAQPVAAVSIQNNNITNNFVNITNNVGSNVNFNTNSVTNNNVTNNFAFVLRNFGSEDRSYVSDDIMKHCYETLSVIPIIKAIYCDPTHPENHTIRIKSDKRKLVEVRENDSWVERDMSSTIDTILRGEYDNVARYFYAYVWPDDSIDYATRAFAQERLIKVKYEKIRFFQERRNAIILLRVGRSSPITPQGLPTLTCQRT